MKKINIILIVIVAVSMVFTSCDKYRATHAVLKTELDSLSYAYGFTNGNTVKIYHMNQVDSTITNPIAELMAGIEQGLKEKSYDQSEAYVKNVGEGIGLQLKTNPEIYGDEEIKVNYKLVRQGLVNGMLGEGFGLNSDMAKEYIDRTMEEVQEKKLEREYGDNKKAGEEFLAENAKKEGVIVTESGLQYEVVEAGKGAKPGATDKVKVHYHGTLIDGTVFDSSVDRGEPTEFYLNQVIKGWTEGLQLMPIGSKYRFYIPQKLAYGQGMTGDIQPFSTLIFDVELIDIVTPAQ